MKKIYLVLGLAIFLVPSLFSQTVLLQENFDGGGPYAFTSSGTPAWGLCSSIQVSSPNSDSATVGLSSVSSLTSNSFSTVGYNFVVLKFKHICKIESQDIAEIQYSVDGGNTWLSLTTTEYQGSGSFTSNKFTEVSYSDWQPGVAGAVPDNTWWKEETFDLSSVAGNQSDVKIRFRLRDGNNNGANLRRGWFIDDVQIIVAPSELVPPTITFVAPIWQDTVNQVGPFTIKALITDASGIYAAKLYYSINAAPFDSIGMTNTALDTFMAVIPAQPYNTHIDYYIKAWDSSQAHNMAQSPTKWFYTKQAPPTVIIGNGSETTNYMPTYGFYNWGWSALLYTSDEINQSGIIDSIFFNVSNTISGYLMNNQRMMIGVVPYTSFADGSMPDSATLTTFYVGDVTWKGPGWFKFTPVQPFYYNGSQSLLIYWINRDGSYASGYPVFKAHTTSVNKAKYKYSDTYSNVFPTSTGTLTTTRPDIKIVFRLNNSTNDAAMAAITSPTTTPIPVVGTPYNLKVKIKNEGSDTLTSVNINYSLNNGAPSTYAWTGNLLQSQISNEILIGSITFTSPGINTLKVWVSSPNGQPDEFNLNDTMVMQYYVCQQVLAGIYTIDKTLPTGGTNFGSFRDALSALQQCGISDTVVLRIAPGTYDTLLNINYLIPGAGVVGPVIFEGAGAQPGDVLIRNTSSDSYVVKLENTRGIWFRNMKLKSMGTSYGRVVVIEGGRDLKIEGCELEGVDTTSTWSDYAVVYSSSSSSEHNVSIERNTIKNGSYGVYYNGYSSTNLDSGLVVKNNTVRDFYKAGLYLNYQYGLVVEGNVVRSNTTSSSPYGIYNYYCHSGQYKKNKVVVPAYYGMYFSNCNGSSGNEGRVENNFVVVGGTSTAYGMYMYSTTYYNVYHNSVNVTSTNATSGRSLYHSSSNNMVYKNNIFANSGGGYSIYVSGGTFTSDYNDLYTTGNKLGYYTGDRNTLADWQSATSQDTHSVSVNPMFVSNEDLHLFNVALNNSGTYVGVDEDIDGEPRDTTTPDIGADEFTPLAHELTVVSIVSPSSGCGLGLEPVIVRLRNNGIDTISSGATISYVLDAHAPVSENISVPIPPDTVIEYTFSTPVNVSVNANDTSYHLMVYVSDPLDSLKINDTLRSTIMSRHVPNPPISSSQTISYGTSATLTATSQDSVLWYADSTLTQLLHRGSTFTTPILFDTTLYYLVSSSEIVYDYTFDNDLQGWQSLTPCSYTTYSWQWNSAGGLGTAFASDPNTNSSQLLQSPIMYVGGDTLLFYMRHKYNTESGYDKGYIAYRINGGAWNRLVPYQGTYTGSGTLGADPIFGSCSTSTVSGGYFSGNSNGYIDTYGKIPVNSSNATLEIALVFYSDHSIGDEGWFIDEIKVVKPGCVSQPVIDTVFVTNTPSVDLATLDILSPNSGIELTNHEQVKIKIKNYGTQPVSNFTVGYQIGNTSPVLETYTDSLLPGGEAIYTFAQTANLSSFQTYQIKAFVAHPQDAYVANDTFVKSVTNNPLIYCSASATSTGYEDLTGITIGSTSYTNPAIGATYQNYDTLPPFILNNGYSYPISVSSGFPPGYSNPYTCWVNVFIDYNHNGVFEVPDERVFSAETNSNDTVSGTIVIPNQTYHGLTRLRVVLRESGTIDNTGPCGTFTWGEVEDYMVNLVPRIPKDAGVVAILSPSDIEQDGVSTPITVKIRNYGTDTLYSIPVTYTLNNQTPVTTVINTTLAPDSIKPFNIGSITPVYGNSNICVYTELPEDSNTFNDQQCKSFYTLPPVVFFADTNDNQSLLTPIGTLWEYGQPAGAIINSAAVGQHAWVTDLDSVYTANAEAYLEFPEMNFWNIDTPHIVFYYWIDAESPYDGGYLQYSLTGGSSWQTLGTLDDPNGYNWYNSYVAETRGWSGRAGGWKRAYYKAAELSNKPNVKLRFVFKSNASIQYEGLAIDEVMILTPKANKDAGVVEILSPVGETMTGTQVQVKVKIKNFGKQVLTSVPVKYRVSTGYPIQTTTWTGNLPPDSIAIVTFTNTYPGPDTTLHSYELCAFTQVNLDPYKFNDTTCITLQTRPNNVGLNNAMLSKVKIYPNPVQDVVFIELPSNVTVDEFTLYNTLIQKVEDITATIDANRLKIQLPQLVNGTYLLWLKTNQGYVRVPITVMNK